jgi:hypothetical protein
MLRRPALVLSLLLSIPILCLAQNATSDNNIFTISVAPPKTPSDLQVRYFLTDGSGPDWYSTAAEGSGNSFIIKTFVQEKPATSFKALVYAPGCQFVTITADNLTSSNRQAEFQCQDLATTPLQGRVPLPAGSQKEFQVEALYVCDWAQRVFDIPRIAVSPLSIAKAKVASDGTFSIDLPDFTQDKLWGSLTYDSALTFVLVDPGSGQRGPMKPPGDSSQRALVKVAPTYQGEYGFSVQF